ncbi:Cupredoxin, partial [Thamnocephalis sphaerospora]
TIRNYYITAEEVIWDYAPSGRDNYHGAPIEQSTHASFYLSNGSGRIGRFNRKAIYRQYADANFTQRMEAPEWLGNLGPIIRAEVGDVVKVHFWNRAPGHDFSVHAHGVAYDRDSEGAAHAKGGAGSSVPPGARYTYLWDVSERAGPGPDDPSSILWFYHSHVDETADLYAGLMGPIIIYRAGHMPRKPQMDGRSHPFGTTLKAGGPDFDREFVVVFMANDENQSPYVRQNIAEFAHNSTSTTSVDYNLEDRSFREPNIKWTVNGRLYNNLPGLDTVVGERVRWYIAGFGEFYDVHSVHFHGATVLRAGQRTDVIQLVPAVFQQTDMVPDVTGTWLLHCHVNSHMMAGM